MGKTSSAVKDKYNAKSYDDIRMRVTKGMRDELKKAAASKGYDSLNGYIKALLEKDTGLDL